MSCRQSVQRAAPYRQRFGPKVAPVDLERIKRDVDRQRRGLVGRPAAAGQAPWKIAEVELGIRTKYSLQRSISKQWIPDALDSMHWIVDQTRQRFGPPEKEGPSDGPTR